MNAPKPYRLEARNVDESAAWAVFYEERGPAEAAFTANQAAIVAGRAARRTLVLSFNGSTIRRWDGA